MPKTCLIRLPLLAFVTLTLAVSAASAQHWYDFGGTYDCTGRSIGTNAVKLSCRQELTRGSRIYTITPSFTIRGPVANKYLGEHEGCDYVPASETKSNQHFVACPGIERWF